MTMVRASASMCLLVGMLWLWHAAAGAEELRWHRHTDAGHEAMSHSDYTEAERQFQTALSIAESLPSNHPYLDSSLANLATLYHAQHYYALAEAFYRRLLTLREHVLGPSHSDVAQVLERYATLLRTMHPVRSWLPWSAASRMAERAERIRQREAAGGADLNAEASDGSTEWWFVDEQQVLSDP